MEYMCKFDDSFCICPSNSQATVQDTHALKHKDSSFLLYTQFLPLSLNPHLHLDLIDAGVHEQGHSALIGRRWPGVAANWVFKMEGEGGTESVRLHAYLCVCFRGDMLLKRNESIRDTGRKSDAGAPLSKYYVNVSLRRS